MDSHLPRPFAWILLTSAACVSGLILAVTLHQIWLLRPLYLSAAVRRDFPKVMTRLREDTGWGLSNFDVREVDCGGRTCDATVDFAYHAPPPVATSRAGLHLTWEIGKPEAYVLQP